LEKIGFGMANNFAKNGYSLKVFDQNIVQCHKLLSQCNNKKIAIAESCSDIASSCDILVTVLPNDEILKKVIFNDVYKNLAKNSIHMSCSTISPTTSRELATLHYNHNESFYVAAPVFARPDGMAKAQATIPVSGNKHAIGIMKPLLQHTSTGIYEFGEDPGAANVVKLCGNFLIASAIESMAEALTLGECNGVNRVQLMEMLNSTIFDCLIYKGYGQRVSQYDHKPYENAHFSLLLGNKDINLVLETAKRSHTPMPLASLLSNRYFTSINKKRENLDWSAIALDVSENAGLDISKKEKDCFDFLVK